MSLSIAVAIMPIAWFLIEKQKLELICERQVLQSQENLTDGENILIEMNVLVRSLVLQKKSLEAAIAAMPAPPVKAALLARLILVIAEIRALRFRQQWIVKMYEVRAQGSLMVLQTKVRLVLRKMESKVGSPPILVLFSSPTPRMKLVPIFVDPLIPTYESPPAFSMLQTLRVNMQFRGKRIFPRWIEFLRSKYVYWEEHCSSHPKKGNWQWESYLGMGKSF